MDIETKNDKPAVPHNLGQDPVVATSTADALTSLSAHSNTTGPILPDLCFLRLDPCSPGVRLFTKNETENSAPLQHHQPRALLSSKVPLESNTPDHPGVLQKLIRALDSPLMQGTSFAALGVGLLGYFFGQYGQHHVLGNLGPHVTYLSDQFGDFGLSAMSQWLVLPATTLAISFKDKFGLLKNIANSTLSRFAPEITAIAVGAYMVLGETIAPQLMPGHTPELLDVPAALAGCLVGYLSVGRLTKREIAAAMAPD